MTPNLILTPHRHFSSSPAPSWFEELRVRVATP